MSPIESMRELGPDERFSDDLPEIGDPRARRPGAGAGAGMGAGLSPVAKPPVHGILTTAAGVLAALLFFAPWIEISCGGVAISAPSGWHLATGRPDPTLEDFAEGAKDPFGLGARTSPAFTPDGEMAEMDARSPFGGPGGGGGMGPGNPDMAKLENRDPRYQVWGVLALAGFATLGGIVTLKSGGKGGLSPAAMIAIGLAGLGLLVFEVVDDFGFEIPPDQPVAVVSSRATSWFYLESASFGLVVLAGFLALGQRSKENADATMRLLDRPTRL